VDVGRDWRGRTRPHRWCLLHDEEVMRIHARTSPAECDAPCGDSVA
jgi:hypothetical protein